MMKNTIKETVEQYAMEDSAIRAYLYIGTKKYELLNFETEFQQEEDFKGQPQNEVKGGLLSLTLKQTIDETLSNWMFRPETSYDGFILFGPVMRIATAPITVTFCEGRCISFEKMIGKNIGTCLTLLISPQEMSINEVKHTNKY